MEKAACDRPGAAIVILSDWRQLDGRLSCVDRAGKNLPRFYQAPLQWVKHMTMNYCGRCGSANGATARFCRQCGADLSSQAAASSSSTPFNVEFSTKSLTKNPERESKPAPPETEPSPETEQVEAEPGAQAPSASATREGGAQDPKAISESLRRIRASGPLILAALKQNNDRQSIDRI